jgi:hypothetical protein
MMAKYEMKAGQFSRGDTYSRITNNMRDIIDDLYALGHDDKENHHFARGQGFLDMGQRLERFLQLLSQLETRGHIQ